MSAQAVELLLEDPQNAPVSKKLKAAFALAHAMTKTPDAQDSIQRCVRTLQELGVPRASIEDAVAIPHHFNYINRVADTLDFPLPQGSGQKLGRLLTLAKKVISSKKPDPYHAICPETKLALPIELIQVRNSLLEAPAELEAPLRRGIEGYCAQLRGAKRSFAQVPQTLEPLLEKISTDAYKVIDEDIQALKDQHYNDTMIFELVICASFGAAMAPLETAYAALQQPAIKQTSTAYSSPALR